LGYFGIRLTADAADEWPTNTVFPKPGTIPVLKGYQDSFFERGLGIEAGADWSALSWKCGKSFSDQPLAPRVALVYGASDLLDIRASYKYISAKDTQDSADDGIDLSRVGVGARAWFNAGHSIYPFISLDVTYYVLSLKNANGERGMPGLSGDLGMAYMITDWLLVHIAIQGEISVADGRAEINGNSENVQVHGLGANFGLDFFF
jgi:hypothetical protein